MNCEGCSHKLDGEPFCDVEYIQKTIIAWKIANNEAWSKVTDCWQTDSGICGEYDGSI